MRITGIFATNFRGMTFNHSIEPITAITGPNRLGKTTILRAASIAMTGSDGFVKANLDLIRKYSIDGEPFSVGVLLDDGTMIERRFAPGRDVSISLMPNGNGGGKKEMERAILERLGNLPITQATLSEELREAKDRTAFLAGLCPMSVSESDVRKELAGVEIPKGQKLSSVDDLTALQTHCDDLVKKLGEECDQAAKAARENSATSVSASCPYSKTDQDKAEKEISEANTAVALAESAAGDAVKDSARIAEIEKDLTAMEFKEVDVEAAEANYKAVLEAKEKDRDGKIKGFDKEIKNKEKEKAVHAEALQSADEKVREIDTDKDELLAKQKKHLAEEAAQNALAKKMESFLCPKCGYKGEDEIAAYRAAAAEAKKNADAIQDEITGPGNQRIEALKAKDSAQHAIAEIEKAVREIQGKRDRVAEFAADKIPEVGEARTELEKARTLDKENQTAKAKRDRLIGERESIQARIEKRVIPDIEALKTARKEKQDLLEKIKAELQRHWDRTVAARNAVMNAQTASAKQTELDKAREAAKRVRNLRIRIIQDSLQPFIDAGAAHNWHPDGYAFAVDAQEERGKVVLRVGLRNGEKFMDFDQLSRAELQWFAFAFALAVYEKRGDKFRPVFADDVDDICGAYGPAFMDLIKRSVDSGAACNVILAGHTLPAALPEGAREIALEEKAAKSGDAPAAEVA